MSMFIFSFRIMINRSFRPCTTLSCVIMNVSIPHLYLTKFLKFSIAAVDTCMHPLKDQIYFNFTRVLTQFQKYRLGAPLY